MNDKQLMFLSVIAYGVVFTAVLAVAGVALDKPAVTGAAVFVAGGSYLTQALAGMSDASSSAWLGFASLVLWAATVVLGVAGAIMVVL